MPVTDETTAAFRYLHSNINTTDVEGLGAFLTAVLGVKETMRSGDPEVETDGAVLGVPGMVRSIATFLYDPRGPRTACAAELVQWFQPVTDGTPYADPWGLGIQAVGYSVADVAAAKATALEHGATTASGPAWDAVTGAATTTLVMPGNGGRLDLVEGSGDVQIRYLRQNVSDLDASLAWYDTIGFQVVDAPAGATVEGRAVRVATLRLPDEDQKLILIEVGASAEAYDSPYHAGIFRSALAVEDPRGAHDRLTADGKNPTAMLHELELTGTAVGFLRIVILRDPDNVMVELVGRDRKIFR